MHTSALRPRHDSMGLAFTQFLFGAETQMQDRDMHSCRSAEATLDNQHDPRRQQKPQHDFAERGLVEAPV
jgi:hypothetical protein